MNIKREYRIAFFAIIVLLAFILGINFLKGRDVFRKHRKFYVVYEQVAGLVEASSVSVNGYNVGKVSKMELSSDKSGKIFVEITVYKDLNIPRNTIARIFSPDLLGTKNIDLVLGDSQILAQSGDTLAAEMQASLSEEVNRQVAPLKLKAEELMSSLDTMVTTVRTIFNSQARENLSQSFDHIRQTISNLEHTTYGLDTLIYGQRTRIERILFNIEAISANLRENDKQITAVISNFEAISDTLAKANIRHTIDDVHSAVMHFSSITDKIDNGEGSLGLLLNDKKLYSNVEKSSKELEQLIFDIKTNPYRYLNFSLFPPGAKRMQYKEPAGQ